jgi:hypothetical protein
VGHIIEEVPGALFVVMRSEGRVGQKMEEAPGVVFVVMRDAVRGGAYVWVRKAWVEGQW